MYQLSVDIVCDECLEAEVFPLEPSATVARKHCRAIGWVYLSGVDLCPECGKNPEIRAKHKKQKQPKRKKK